MQKSGYQVSFPTTWYYNEIVPYLFGAGVLPLKISQLSLQENDTQLKPHKQGNGKLSYPNIKPEVHMN